jgi:glycosyltransferase involved in cell wall biosynthesis
MRTRDWLEHSGMNLRVIDYAANLGGGVRFAVETMRALSRQREIRFELVSHGEALERYRSILKGDGVEFRDIAPTNSHRMRRRWWMHLPIVSRLAYQAGVALDFHFDVPPEALGGADVVWFPWTHRHRIPEGSGRNVVGSLHDVILIDFKQHFPGFWTRSEVSTISRWLRSPAQIVVSSRATGGAVERLFGIDAQRLAVVPLSGGHSAHDRVPAGAEARFGLASDAYFLCPANISAHKNHEVLFEGFARSDRRLPLVLTGEGTDLAEGPSPRAAALRSRLRALGLALGRDVRGLGYVDPDGYHDLLSRARALVMPTLAEGGGSFPVWEALLAGIPVVCSDIPVMREMMERVGGDVLWFDPRRPDELAARLRELDERPDELKRNAVAQVPRLRDRSWDEVARDYVGLLERALDRSATRARTPV